MSTFYGYAERQAEDNVDWSVIGKEITTMLQTEAERRETLKTELDNSSRKYGETLSNAPTGQHEGASSGVLEFASNAEQARLIQDRLLKSGQLKVKDYLKQRKNLTDGTTGLFAAAKEFQAAFESKASRMNDDEAMELEFELFKLTEGFGNWNNVGAYINPTNYEVSMGKKKRVMGKDGKYVYEMGDRPEEFFTVAELRNFISLKLDRYDVEGALNKHAASLAPMTSQIVVETPDGYKTIKISDATGRTFDQLDADQKKLVNDFKKAEDNMIKEMMANAYNNTSILTDYIGGYSFTWDPDEAGDKKILLEKDPQNKIPIPKFDPKQEKAIKEALRSGIRQRIDKTYSETFVQKREQSATLLAWKKSQADKQNEYESIMKSWVELAAAGVDENTAKDAGSYIVNLYNEMSEDEDKKILRVVKKGNNMVFKFKDETESAPMSMTNQESYIRTLKTLFPQTFKGLSDTDLERLGKNEWSYGEKVGGEKSVFNKYDVSQGVSVDFDIRNLTVDMKKDGDILKPITSTQTFQEQSGYDNSATKLKAINTAGIKLLSAFNKKMAEQGLSPYNLTLEADVGNQRYEMKNRDNNASIIYHHANGDGMSQIYEDFEVLSLELKKGDIDSEEILAGRLVALLDRYQAVLVHEAEDKDKAGTILIIGGKEYTMPQLQNSESEAFKALVNSMKNIGEAKFGTTTIDETADVEVDTPSEYQTWLSNNPGGNWLQFEQQRLKN